MASWSRSSRTRRRHTLLEFDSGAGEVFTAEALLAGIEGGRGPCGCTSTAKDELRWLGARLTPWGRGRRSRSEPACPGQAEGPQRRRLPDRRAARAAHELLRQRAPDDAEASTAWPRTRSALRERPTPRPPGPCPRWPPCSLPSSRSAIGVTHLTAEALRRHRPPWPRASGPRGTARSASSRTGSCGRRRGSTAASIATSCFKWNPESFVELVASAREIMQAEQRASRCSCTSTSIPPHGPFTHPEAYQQPVRSPNTRVRSTGTWSPRSEISEATARARSPRRSCTSWPCTTSSWPTPDDRHRRARAGGRRDAGRGQGRLLAVRAPLGSRRGVHAARNVLGHALHVYEEQVRIPLILSAPGLRACRRGLDREPTGQPARPVPDARGSVRPARRPLRANCRGAPSRACDGTHERSRAGRDPSPFSSRYRGNTPSRQVGLRLGGYKLVVTRSRTQWDAELFNLSLDPREEHDLSDELPLLAPR